MSSKHQRCASLRMVLSSKMRVKEEEFLLCQENKKMPKGCCSADYKRKEMHITRMIILYFTLLFMTILRHVAISNKSINRMIGGGGA